MLSSFYLPFIFLNLPVIFLNLPIIFLYFGAFVDFFDFRVNRTRPATNKKGEGKTSENNLVPKIRVFRGRNKGQRQGSLERERERRGERRTRRQKVEKEGSTQRQDKGLDKD